MRTYTELMQLPTYLERYNYLKLDGHVGIETFGFDRYINQALYKDKEWKRIRREVILRDKGFDLGHHDYSIPEGVTIIVHHMNPLTEDDIRNRMSYVLDPEFLITTALNTHNAIHYGDESLLALEPILRMPNDTCPWRK